MAGQTVRVSRRVDLLAVAAAVLTFGVVFFYLLLVAQQGGRPTGWAVALLTAAGGGAIYASRLSSRFRRTVLGLSGTVLLLLGYLTVFTIGLPLLLSGGLCVASATRGGPPKDWRDTV